MSILILSMSFCIFWYNQVMFGKRLKELRIEKGVTQKQLASAIDCHQSMVARWEACECEPCESVIRKVALYFNVSSDYLLGLEDETGAKSFKGTFSGYFEAVRFPFP